MTAGERELSRDPESLRNAMMTSQLLLTHWKQLNILKKEYIFISEKKRKKYITELICWKYVEI